MAFLPSGDFPSGSPNVTSHQGLPWPRGPSLSTQCLGSPFFPHMCYPRPGAEHSLVPGGRGSPRPGAGCRVVGRSLPAPREGVAQVGPVMKVCWAEFSPAGAGARAAGTWAPRGPSPTPATCRSCSRPSPHWGGRPSCTRPSLHARSRLLPRSTPAQWSTVTKLPAARLRQVRQASQGTVGPHLGCP